MPDSPKTAIAPASAPALEHYEFFAGLDHIADQLALFVAQDRTRGHANNGVVAALAGAILTLAVNLIVLVQTPLNIARNNRLLDDVGETRDVVRGSCS